MPDKKPEPGAGDVPIILGGEEMVLKPSLAACMQISKLAGNSLDAAAQRCARLDFDFVCELIAIGLDATSPALRKQVQQKVYEQGVISVAATCITYVRVIMSGGRLVSPAEQALDSMADVARVTSENPELADLMTSVEALMESLRQALEQEAGADAEGPLAESKSPSESSIDA